MACIDQGQQCATLYWVGHNPDGAKHVARAFVLDPASDEPTRTPENGEVESDKEGER
jgi:hypothetical protein